MKLAYHNLLVAKRLYDKATMQEDKDRIAHGFMQDADIVLSEMKKKLEEDERDV